MASITDKKKLLYKLAKAYYEDNLTQGEIGKRFGLSRIKVSRLLQQARDERIVQITIIPPQEPNAELERKLEARFGLDEAVIVFPSSYDKETVVQELGPPAAECLLRSLQGNEVISISWGTTLLSVVEALSLQAWPEMKVVQMLGGLGRPESETYGADLVHLVAQLQGLFLHEGSRASGTDIVHVRVLHHAVAGPDELRVLASDLEDGVHIGIRGQGAVEVGGDLVYDRIGPHQGPHHLSSRAGGADP